MTACSRHLSIEHRERHPEMVRHLTRWHPATEQSFGRRDFAPCHAAWTPDPPTPSLGRIRAQCDLNKNGRRNPHLRKCPSYILRLYCTSLPPRIQYLVIQLGPASHFDCKRTIMALLVQKVLLTLPT